METQAYKRLACAVIYQALVDRKKGKFHRDYESARLFLESDMRPWLDLVDIDSQAFIEKMPTAMRETEELTGASMAVQVEQLTRVARIYHNNADAAAALEITRNSFGRLCRRHGIETPHERKRRKH